MAEYPRPLARLVDKLVRLPGVGPKTAQRLAFFIIEEPGDYAAALAAALVEAKTKVRFCGRCHNLTSNTLCAICANAMRKQDVICVVQDVRDLLAIEKTGTFQGIYHVLGGAIAPLEGIGPEDIRARELARRVKEEHPTEVILATNANLAGEQTAMYLVELLRELPVKVTRIASGLPVGGEIEYADEITITKALESRREI